MGLIDLFVWFLLFFRVLHLSFSISCHKDLRLNWSVTISNSPVVSAPLLVQSRNGDQNQLVVTTHDGTVSIINTDSGSEDEQWPVHFPESAFFAGPLMYDIDQDGSMDILLTSSDGEILFLSCNGTTMTDYTIVLPRLLVNRQWHALSLDSHSETGVKPSNTWFTTSEAYKKYREDIMKSFIILDTHILSTPVIGDFNGDNINSELIVPVNFYLEDEVKRSPERLKDLNLEASKVDFYLANGIIIVDLKTRKVISNITFELTMKSSTFPAYLLSSPTVTDLDGNNSSPEVIIGSLSGKLHVYNKNGKYPQTFQLTDSIHGETAVGDVNSDENLEVIFVDGSANVVCYDKDKVMWEASVSGTITAGAQLQDINLDGIIEVIIATNDGYIWVLDGASGKVLPNWPMKLGDEIHSKVLFNQNSNHSVDIIVMCDGKINIIDGSSQCLEIVPTEEVSYVPVIFHTDQMSYIISTSDGALLSFQQQNQSSTFLGKKQTSSVKFTNAGTALHPVTASTFDIEFEISDHRNKISKWESQTITLCFSTEKGIYYFVKEYDTPGIYSVTLKSPKAPKKTYILLEACSRHKQCTEDIIYITFYPNTKDNLILYMLLPFLIMTCLLLVLHGYPEGNLLPTWESTKRH